MGRLFDAAVRFIEAGIERFADPERIRCLEEALRNADRRTAEFAHEAGEASDRLERVLSEVGCALGVEGEPDAVLFAAAWEARGRTEWLEGILELMKDENATIRTQLEATQREVERLNRLLELAEPRG
jgi:hypothetical protein